ncbi:MAG: 23S rRNA (pseudouridine(1915)-N(3))-methyltransferase RlmH [Acetobacteraceae bacterium]
MIAVGRGRGSEEQALYDRYAARLRPPPKLVEIAEPGGEPAERRRREGEAILSALPPGAALLALDEGGETLPTAAFAERLARLREAGRQAAFAIGGAEGLSRDVLDRADAVLAFGAATWPHLLVRAMLAEQLYRADAILRRHPYHRAGRP